MHGRVPHTFIVHANHELHSIMQDVLCITFTPVIISLFVVRHTFLMSSDQKQSASHGNSTRARNSNSATAARFKSTAKFRLSTQTNIESPLVEKQIIKEFTLLKENKKCYIAEIEFLQIVDKKEISCSCFNIY